MKYKKTKTSTKRNYTIEKTAGMILVNKKLNKILLVKSTGGFWGFPKGHREKEDKTVLDNAIREVQEEIGIKVKHDEIVKNYKNVIYQYFFRRNSKKPKERKNGWIKKEVVLFTAIIDDTKKIKKQHEEISDIKWMSFSAARNNILNTEIKKFGEIGPLVKKYIKVINRTERLLNTN